MPSRTASTSAAVLRGLRGAAARLRRAGSRLAPGRAARRRHSAELAALARAAAAVADSERRYRALFEASPVGIGVVDAQGLFTEVNDALCDIVGRTPDELIGSTSAVYTHPDDVHLTARAVSAAGSHGRGSFRKRIVRPDGEVRWVELAAASSEGGDGEPWIIAHLQDVTEQVAAERVLQRSGADRAAVAEVMRGASAGSDVRSAIVAGAVHIAGANAASLLERDGSDLVVTAEQGQQHLGLRVPLDEPSATTHVWRTGEPLFAPDPGAHPLVSARLLEMVQARSLLWQPVLRHGEVVAVLTVSWPMRVPTPDDGAVHAVQMLAVEAGVALEREALIRSLSSQAATDALTGLANRRSWDERLAVAMSSAARRRAPLAVALLDLDHFKAYNDRFGHAAGDALLRDFAATAERALRTPDLLARWGGEEFALLLTDVSDARGAEEAVERVRHCIPAPSTCSAGLAMWDGVESAQQLLSRADTALYEAKRLGRDRIVLASATAGPAAQPEHQGC